MHWLGKGKYGGSMASDTHLLGRLLKGSLGYLRRIIGAPAGTRHGQPRKAGTAAKAGRTRNASTGVGQLSRPYPGDFRGAVSPRYSPDPDGKPDPGEIVWSWVPYEEDYSQGKDRPVLLIGHDGGWLLGLMLTSKDHDKRPPCRRLRRHRHRRLGPTGPAERGQGRPGGPRQSGGRPAGGRRPGQARFPTGGESAQRTTRLGVDAKSPEKRRV